MPHAIRYDLIYGKAKASLLLLLHVCLLLRFDILSETTAVEVTAVLRPALKPSRHTPLPRGPTRMTCQGAFWGLRSTRSQSTSLVMPEAEPHNLPVHDEWKGTKALDIQNT